MSIGVCTARSSSSHAHLRCASRASNLRPCRKCCRRMKGGTISTTIQFGRGVRATRSEASTCFANVTSGTIVRYELSTAVAQKCLLIEGMVSEQRQRIIISGVRQKSPAWESGVRPGDEIVGISDPNLETVWEFDEMTSLRFVKDALRMRIPDTVTLLINKNPPPLGNMEGDMIASAELQGTRRSSQAGEGQDYLDAVLSSVESDDSDAERPADDVTSDLERRYRQMQLEKTRSTQRIKARKAALSTVSERNDAPFFLTIVAVFLGPPLLILIWAFTSGYLDSLSSMY